MHPGSSAYIDSEKPYHKTTAGCTSQVQSKSVRACLWRRALFTVAVKGLASTLQACDHARPACQGGLHDALQLFCPDRSDAEVPGAEGLLLGLCLGICLLSRPKSGTQRQETYIVTSGCCLIYINVRYNVCKSAFSRIYVHKSVVINTGKMSLDDYILT